MKMNDRPLVSIVIPAYKAANYLREAIDSALAQTYPNIEIIVVNDGSPDEGATRKIALSYGDKIRYIEKENGGSSSALNAGINAMQGEWFSWLSHDDLYCPQKVEKQIEYMLSLGLSEEEVKNHFFFTGCDFIDAKGGYIKKAKLTESENMHRHIEALVGNEYLIAEPTRYNFYGCGCLIHKSVFEKVGGFDEKLRLINDMDMWYRIYAGGFKLHFIPEALIMGRLHSGQISRSIGFSYHNSEQDMFWKRSLDFLLENHGEDFEVFRLFGENAYSKTRTADGDRAFARAIELCLERKNSLKFKAFFLKAKAALRSFAKKVYMKIFMK